MPLPSSIDNERSTTQKSFLKKTPAPFSTGASLYTNLPKRFQLNQLRVMLLLPERPSRLKAKITVPVSITIAVAVGVAIRETAAIINVIIPASPIIIPPFVSALTTVVIAITAAIAVTVTVSVAIAVGVVIAVAVVIILFAILQLISLVILVKLVAPLAPA